MVESEKISDFACSCGDKQKKRMEELHEWVRETFHVSDRQDFYCTSLLYTLAADYTAWIKEIPLDPGGWGAVQVSAEPNESLDQPEGYNLFVQFDRLEDGIALSLKLLHNKYGRMRKWIDE